MKTSTTLAIMAMILCSLNGCKKSSSNHQQKILVTTSNVSKGTDYIIKVTDKTSGGLSLDVTAHGNNDTYSFTADGGNKLSVHYSFTGQGMMDITCNGQNLLHANGGYSDDYGIIVPK